MIIRYLGHSCFEIVTAGRTLLVDPFISGNPLASDIDIRSLEPHYLLITHGHNDHVSDAVAIAKANQSLVVSNFEIVTWFEKHGIGGHGMNLGGALTFDFGTVKYVTAQHSSTLPDGSPGGNPGGFVLWNAEGCLYIAGDTALTLDMQLIPKICPPLSAAILPVGDCFTMGYRDALIAAEFVQCDRVIGCHYDTFDVIAIDHDAAINAFVEEDRELLLLSVGDSVTL